MPSKKFQTYDPRLLPLARKLRREMTSQERHLWHGWLRKLPFRFQRQKPIGPYIADFYCHRARLVVEIDGWRHFTPDGLAADARRTAWLESRGFMVYRCRGHAVDADIAAVATAIEALARRRIAEFEAEYLGP